MKTALNVLPSMKTTLNVLPSMKTTLNVLHNMKTALNMLKYYTFLGQMKMHIRMYATITIRVTEKLIADSKKATRVMIGSY